MALKELLEKFKFSNELEVLHLLQINLLYYRVRFLFYAPYIKSYQELIYLKLHIWYKKQGQIVQTNSLAVSRMRDARTQSSAKQKPNVSPEEKKWNSGQLLTRASE